MSNKIKSLKKKVLTFSIAGAIAFTPLMVNAELGDQTLALGMKNNDVKVLQDNLKELNYLKVEDYGTYYDEVTQEAVVAFQEANGINADGTFGDDSFKALEIALKKNLGEEITLSYNRLLKSGSKGKDVKALQDGLKELDFLKVKETDEVFGDAVEQAVMDFQATYKLTVDGVAGRDTFNLLGKILKGQVKKEKPKTASRGSSLANDKGSKVVASAMTHKGKPYVFGASNGKSFDCSGYTQYVYKQNGISIPRTTSSQASVGKKVSKGNLQVGDLVIFSNTYKAGPSHAGIYIGGNNFIHASSGGKKVMVSSLNQSYYRNKFSYGRRVF